MSINQPPILDSSLKALSDWNLALTNVTNRIDDQLKDVLAGGKINIEGDYVKKGTLKTSAVESDSFSEIFTYKNYAMNNNQDYTFTWIPSKVGQKYEAYAIAWIDVAGTINAGMVYAATVSHTGGDIGTWSWNNTLVGTGAINGGSMISTYASSSTPFTITGGYTYTTTMNINDTTGYTSARGMAVMVFVRNR